MDRKTIYAGQVPLETDLLGAQQFAMTALAELSQTILGTPNQTAPTLVDSFTCTPTIPASLNVIITPGTVYQLENLEQSTWSSLPQDTVHSILKQGVLLDPQTFGITPPGTVGFSQAFLVEVQYQDFDTGSLVDPYFNAANPAVPFAGPGNAGTAQNTVRKGLAFLQVKAGVAAATGTQVTPSPDPGYAGLFVITVANGAATITAGNIVTYVNAPFLAINGHLPQIPTGVQYCSWTFANDTSAGGSPPATTSSTTTSSAVLTFSGGVPAFITTGMKVADLTTPGAITGGQTVQSIGSTTVTLTANVNATVNSGDLIAFSNNAMAATIAPGALNTPASLSPGLSVRIKCSGTNAGSTTFNLNGLGANAVHRATGANVQAGDLPVGMIVELTFDGSAWQMVNFEGSTSATSITNNFSTFAIPYAVDSGTVNTVVGPFSPAVSSLTAGLTVEVKIANTNTGAATLQCNSLTAAAIVDRNQAPLAAGAMVAGEVCLFIYDGTHFQLVTDVASPHGMQVFNTSGTSNFTVPAGVFQLYVQVWGGGGGGSASDGDSTPISWDDQGFGGAGGGYASGWVAVTPGQVVSVTVGAGGAGAPNSSTGGNGGTTSFGAFMSATGGTGGFQLGPATFNDATSPAAGGMGTGGTINLQGGSGSPGWDSDFSGTANTGAGSLPAQPSGGTPFGAPPAMPWSQSGNWPGGGGSGAPCAQPSNNGVKGGNGAAGGVIVQW